MTGKNIVVVQVSSGLESFLVGGTIARLIEEGNSVTVITCVQAINAALREAETGELFRALMELKVTDHRFLGTTGYRRLGYGDRRYYLPEEIGAIGTTGGIPLPTEEQQHPTSGDISTGALSLTAENIDEIDQDFNAIFNQIKPEAILLALPEKLGISAEIISQFCIQQGEDRKIPVYQFAWQTEARDKPLDEVEVIEQIAVKKAAIGHHHSLGKLIGDSVQLSNGENVLIHQIEGFRLIYEPYATWSRLGLLASTIVAIFAGALITLFGTLLHNQTANFGGVSVPSGVTLALVVILLFVLGTRLACQHPLVLYAASGTVIAAIFVFGLFEIQGQVLIGDTIGGWIWLIGAPMLALIIGLWPSVQLPAARAEHSTIGHTRFKRKVR